MSEIITDNSGEEFNPFGLVSSEINPELETTSVPDHDTNGNTVLIGDHTYNIDSDLLPLGEGSFDRDMSKYNQRFPDSESDEDSDEMQNENTIEGNEYVSFENNTTYETADEEAFFTNDDNTYHFAPSIDNGVDESKDYEPTGNENDEGNSLDTVFPFVCRIAPLTKG